MIVEDKLIRARVVREREQEGSWSRFQGTQGGEEELHSVSLYWSSFGQEYCHYQHHHSPN